MTGQTGLGLFKALQPFPAGLTDLMYWVRENEPTKYTKENMQKQDSGALEHDEVFRFENDSPGFS